MVKSETMSVTSILTGKRVLEEVNSPINGKLTVVKDLAWGVHINGGGLAQSGGVMKTVWTSTLKKIKSQKFDITTCLILGLGGGDAARLIRKYWPDAKITGVDIDSVIVELGRKHMKLDEAGVEIVIQDASKYLTSNINNLASNFDLVLVDMYVQDNVPEKFKSDKFIREIKSLLVKDGMAIFNRIYYGEKRSEAVKFENRLAKVFSDITIIYPEANVMFLCSI
jgi:spermidine synthase